MKKLFFLLGVGALFLFIVFSYVVHRNAFTASDFDNTVRLQDHIGLRFVSPFSFLSDVGKVEVVSVFLLILLAIHRKLKTILVFVFFGFFHFVEIYGKTFVHHLPPPHFMLRTQNVLHFPQFYVTTQNSYPSGHEGRAFFLTTLIAVLLMKSRKLSSLQKISIIVIMLAYDLLMGVSRVYLGEHWTSDVIGGALLGTACGLFGAVFL